jgi:hypothetical protein
MDYLSHLLGAGVVELFGVWWRHPKINADSSKSVFNS